MRHYNIPTEFNIIFPFRQGRMYGLRRNSCFVQGIYNMTIKKSKHRFDVCQNLGNNKIFTAVVC